MIHSGWMADFSIVFWPALAKHLWQSTIFAGLCFLVSPAFRNCGARARYALWALAFVRFAVPPVFPATPPVRMPLLLEQSLGAPFQQVSIAVAPAMRPSMWLSSESGGPGDPAIYSLLTIAWIGGCALFFGVWWLRQLRLAQTLKNVRHESGEDLIHAIDSLRTKIGIRRHGSLRVVLRGSDAGVSGVWSPILVLPELMLRQLTPDEVEAVLAHELVHISRMDNLWNNLQMALCCIFWFYPAIWILDRRLTTERERSCDERVIGLLHNSGAYVSGLIKMAGIGLGLQLARGSAMTRSSLGSRIAALKLPAASGGIAARILLPSMATLAVFLYFLAEPPRNGIAQTGEMSPAVASGCSTRLVSVTFANGRQSVRPPSGIRCGARVPENKQGDTSMTSKCRTRPATQTASRVIAIGSAQAPDS